MNANKVCPALLVFAWAIHCGSQPSQFRLPIEFTLSEGQSFELPSIDLKVEAIQVRDLTSQGCLGGPTGCRDSVYLNIAHGTESRELTLQVAHTLAQEAQGIHQALAFGYRVTLETLRDGLATLSIDGQ